MLQPSKPSSTKPSRRGFMAGGATIGAAAVAAASLPGVGQQQPAADAPPPKPERGGGYRVSEHVRRYYKTTLV